MNTKLCLLLLAAVAFVHAVPLEDPPAVTEKDVDAATTMAGPDDTDDTTTAGATVVDEDEVTATDVAGDEAKTTDPAKVNVTTSTPSNNAVNHDGTVQPDVTTTKEVEVVTDEIVDVTTPLVTPSTKKDAEEGSITASSTTSTTEQDTSAQLDEAEIRQVTELEQLYSSPSASTTFVTIVKTGFIVGSALMVVVGTFICGFLLIFGFFACICDRCCGNGTGAAGKPAPAVTKKAKTQKMTKTSTQKKYVNLV